MIFVIWEAAAAAYTAGMATAADRQKAFEFLSNHRVASLATVSAEGAPMSAVIYYVPDKDLNILFLTKTETAKYINICNNHRVSLAIYDEANLSTIQIEGTAAEVSQTYTVDKVFKSIVKRPGELPHWPPPIIKMLAGDAVVMKITPSRLRFADFRQTKPASQQNYFTMIIP